MPHKSNEIISTHHLAIGYKNKSIVSDINIAINSGEFIGILGTNGSGKSTFLRVLLGLIRPLKGQVFIFGKPPQKGNMQIGYMPQMRTTNFIANLTSKALLETCMGGTFYGLPTFSKSKEQELQRVLNLVNAAPLTHRPIQQLSGGERQRIFLAQALLDNPKILLLDEPLANLDPRNQDNFINLLQTIQKKLNVTILFTAHDPNPLLDVMSRVLYFAHGKVIMGNVDKIITSTTLSALYEIPIEVIRFKNRLFVIGEGHHLSQENHHHV